MTKHIPDDDRHENGESIPHQGTPIDPSSLPSNRPSDPFEGRWKTLGQWGHDWLSVAPQRRRWLLERPNKETNGRANPDGVLPLGKVGMMVAAGGAGKTMALVQLALCIATGRDWLDYFGTPNPGHVLLALGEEDEEEIRRRMFNAACAMRLTDEQKRLAAERIVALPLAGTPVALTESDGRNTTASSTLYALQKRLNDADHEWRLIVMDPLSRFAGCDTEKDNAAATRFVEAAESLTKSKGGPTVMLAHHTNKLSRSAESESNAASARGASGLIDGVRWVANLDPDGDSLAKLAVTKSNYALRGPAITLVRDTDNGGALRAERSEERSKRESETAKRPAENRGRKQVEDFDA
jgi:regulatory protein RepA